MRDNRDTSCKLRRATEKKKVVHVTPDTLLFKLLRAKHNSTLPPKPLNLLFSTIIYVVLCEFESERKN